ncbi:hypothetical protein HDU76_011542 [Blyttiomyces sp. JEL0837]|nr:hypothetical protein HDU76_011542 [Blyttiomyces sp. JEL0837]
MKARTRKNPAIQLPDTTSTTSTPLTSTLAPEADKSIADGSLVETKTDGQSTAFPKYGSCDRVGSSVGVNTHGT